MGDVTLVSEIPESHPKKGAIERDVEAVLGPLPGPWRVMIRRSRGGAAWWGFVEIHGPEDLRRILIVDSPEEIRSRLKEAFSDLQADRIPHSQY